MGTSSKGLSSANKVQNGSESLGSKEPLSNQASIRNRITRILLERQSPTAIGSYSLSYLPTEIIQAHGNWIRGYLNQGWGGYLLTFMFQQIPGSVDTKVQQMHREIERVYSRLSTRVVRKPTSENWAWLLPKGVFFPDLPGLKPTKQTLRDVRINDGLHFHGVVVANRWGRMKETLETHFREKGTEYLSDVLRRIHVERITHDSDFVADYAGKAIKRKRFQLDHVLVLPKALSELPDTNGHLSCNPRDQAIKAIQSASNVSEKVAQEIYDAARAGAKISR